MNAPPNIILIVTDQQRYDTIRALGADWMETPNYDRMVKEGVSFTNCHVTAPSCVPSRASLFTGQYPHTTGIFTNADRWTHNWVEELAASGYHCVNVGKMHTIPLDCPAGFHERYVVENKDRYLMDRHFADEWDKGLRARGLVKQQREQYRKLPDYKTRLGAFDWIMPEETHSDFFVGDMAKWWIETKPNPQKPLFLQIGFPGPHPPFDPVPRYVERYQDKQFPAPKLNQDDLDGQPRAMKGLRTHNCEVDHDSVVHQTIPSQEASRRQRAYYYANVTMIDEKIGEIMASLKTAGYLENAVVIVTSDHGEMLGDHGHIQKWTMYEEVTRVPLIIWSPERFKGDRRVESLCQWMDIGATIRELAGLKPNPDVAARSLMAPLDGTEWQPRPYVYAEQSRDGNLTETDFMTMVRSKDWKLVHFVGEDDGQLFDLRTDPREEHNLWHDRAHAQQRQIMLDELREWRVRDSYHSRNWARAWR